MKTKGMNHTKLDYEKIVESRLEEIKKHKLDILILQRKNEELCRDNDQRIEELNTDIGRLEIEIEDLLKKSEQRKIDTPVGFASFRAMPDYWEYDDEVILDWCEKKKMPYYKVVKTVKRQELKDDILAGKLKADQVKGIKIEPRDPKFIYKLKGVI